jgi:hypothetical protein
MNTVMKFCFRKMQGISGVDEALLASHEELRYMGLLLLFGIVSGYARCCPAPRVRAAGSRIRVYGNECIRPRTL